MPDLNRCAEAPEALHRSRGGCASCYGVRMAEPLDSHPSRFTGPEDEDTIELELTAEQMRALTGAAAPRQSDPVSAPPAETSLPSAAPEIQVRAPLIETPSRFRPGAVVVPGVAATLLLLGGGLSVATKWARSVGVDAQVAPRATIAETPDLPQVSDAPVHFTNPFDTTEVFEFPPGTTETEAHDAVAQFLLRRARDRQPSPKVTREDSKAAARTTALASAFRDPG